MEPMALGLFALTFLIISVCCLSYKKPVLGLVCSVTAMALTYLAGSAWKELLTESGKDPTFLGLNRYPAAVIILTIQFISSFILMLVSGICRIKQKKNNI